MGEGFQILDIILLAMIAGFIALRLRSVLGRRTGHERPPSEQTQARYGGAETKGAVPPAEAAEDVTPADYRLIVKPGSPAADGVDDIARADSHFNLQTFVQGARGAYEMILEGFWQGDREAFRGFVSDDIFRQFDDAINARETAGETLKNTLERVRSLEVVEARLVNGTASIMVRFTADVVAMTVDSEGRVLSGNPVDKVEVKDVWTFERSLTSSDPNWTLVATRSED